MCARSHLLHVSSKIYRRQLQGENSYFNTANGPSPSDQVIDISVPELSVEDGIASPYAMKHSSPFVLSIGGRRRRHGYNFNWTSEGEAFWLSPAATLIFCVERRNIPYLVSGDSRCAPMELDE